LPSAPPFDQRDVAQRAVGAVVERRLVASEPLPSTHDDVYETAGRLQPLPEALTRPPRLSRLVALAHKLEGLVRSGTVKDFVEMARLTRVSAARIHQIVRLAQLAPPIQERILFLAPEEAH